MSVELHFNQRRAEGACGSSLFDCAELLGIRVPTSCRNQGKCKECLVEITEGMRFLSAPGPQETHLAGNFRLSCSCRINAEAGVVRCHTMRRGEMRIEKHAPELPVTHKNLKLAPAVSRDGRRVLLDSEEIDRTGGTSFNQRGGLLIEGGASIGFREITVRFEDCAQRADVAKNIAGSFAERFFGDANASLVYLAQIISVTMTPKHKRATAEGIADEAIGAGFDVPVEWRGPAPDA